MKLEVIKVVKTENKEGKGTKEDPVRTVVRYWGMDGNLIKEEVLVIS